jgi:hypothetical protein
MRTLAVAIGCSVLLTGCSPVGSGLLGGVLGAGAAGGSYEYHLKRQKDWVEADFKAGKIDLTFPRFQRHLYKEEQDEIGGQHDHPQDTTALHGRI